MEGAGLPALKIVFERECLKLCFREKKKDKEIVFVGRLLDSARAVWTKRKKERKKERKRERKQESKKETKKQRTKKRKNDKDKKKERARERKKERIK